MHRVALVTSLLVVSMVAGPAAAAAGAGTQSVNHSSSAQSAAGDAASVPTIQKSVRLYLTPSTPGEIDVAVTYDVPDVLTSLSVTLPTDARNVRTDDFTRGDGKWAWDGDSDPARLRFSVPANETTAGKRAVERSNLLAQDGEYSFVDAGSWALVTVPSLRTQWGWRNAESVELSQSTTVDGEGSTGGEIAFLGPVDVHTRTANGQTFHLAVPAAADMAESPSAVLDALAAASSRLRVGERDASVWMAAAPTTVKWGIRGVEYGGDDAWVAADAQLQDAGNVWYHEYVHTRQAFGTTTSGRWTVEASAEYYAAFLSLREGFVEFDEFQRYLAYGEREPWDDAVLAEPSSWPAGANYLKGSLVWGSIDRQVRLVTDSSATMADVFYRLNRLEGPVSNDDFLTVVADVSSLAVGQYAQEYTETRAAPEMWTRAEHAAAFGTRPPRMTYDVGGYHVTGPFRNATFREVPTVYVGEVLTVGGKVTNTGGATGTYLATLSVDGRTLARSRGDLQPGETAVLTLQHRFTEAGTYNLTLGRTRVPVEVEPPASPVVSSLSVTPDSVSTGESVTVTATLSNPTDAPARGTVPVTLAGSRVGAFDVTLAAGESVTRNLTVSLTEPGVATIRAGDRSVRVDVAGGGVSVPGFGVAAGVAGVAAAALVAALRER
ncbi:MAG: hypothetical protein ABEJ88_07650 [Halobacterium sp.]